MKKAKEVKKTKKAKTHVKKKKTRSEAELENLEGRTESLGEAGGGTEAHTKQKKPQGKKVRKPNKPNKPKAAEKRSQNVTACIAKAKVVLKKCNAAALRKVKVQLKAKQAKANVKGAKKAVTGAKARAKALKKYKDVKMPPKKVHEVG